jgi:hypothetical protein
MTALAADRMDSRLSEGTIQGPFPVVGSDIVYKHALVCCDANGYLVPASDTAALTHVQGISVQHYDNAGGSSGDLDARVMSGIGVNLACTGASQAWVGRDVYAVDDQTVALAATTTNVRLVGRVLRVISATEVVVFIPLGGNGG